MIKAVMVTLRKKTSLLLKNMIQLFSLNAVWYKPDLVHDLSPEEKYTKLLNLTLIYSIRCLFVDNAEIFEIVALNITPHCDKMIPWAYTIYKLTYRYRYQFVREVMTDM